LEFFGGGMSVLRLLEFRNLFHHKGLALEMREREIRSHKGSVRIHAPLAFESQSYKRAYIRYTQQLHVEHPPLTILDHLLVGEAWQAGSECGAQRALCELKINCHGFSRGR
jgi:hypothetical protein